MLQIYKSLESGPLQELTLKTLEKGAWINIVDPTPYELKVVSNLTEVDPDFLRSALDDEERSHTDVEENSVMVLTNVPVFRGEDSYDALPLAIIVTDEYIITVCLEETPVITEFNERTSRLFRTYKKTRFLFQILYKSATYFLRYLRQISKLSEEIEDQLRHEEQRDPAPPGAAEGPDVLQCGHPLERRRARQTAAHAQQHEPDANPQGV